MNDLASTIRCMNDLKTKRKQNADVKSLEENIVNIFNDYMVRKIFESLPSFPAFEDEEIDSKTLKGKAVSVTV